MLLSFQCPQNLVWCNKKGFRNTTAVPQDSTVGISVKASKPQAACHTSPIAQLLTKELFYPNEHWFSRISFSFKNSRNSRLNPMNNPTSPCGFNLFSLKPIPFQLHTMHFNHVATRPVSPCIDTLCSLNKTLNASKLHAFIVHLLMKVCSNNYVLLYSNATMFTCHNISMFQTLQVLLSR